MSPVFPVKGLTAGKPMDDKLIALLLMRVHWVDSKYPSSGFATSVGVERLAAETPVGDGAATFDLPSLADKARLKVGDQLVVSNRFTATVPLKDDPKFAKYFKMLKMHLPPQAVKNKMEAEGLDDLGVVGAPPEVVA